MSDVLLKAGAILLCIFVFNTRYWKRGVCEYIQGKGSQLFKNFPGVNSKVTAVSEEHSGVCLPVSFKKTELSGNTGNFTAANSDTFLSLSVSSNIELN